MSQSLVIQAREYLSSLANTNIQITRWDQLVDYAKVLIRDPGTEEFHVLYLDRKNRLISATHEATGTVDHCPVYPREVLKKALLLDASALILIHNHPSGDPIPSSADIEMTDQIAQGAQSLGITLHDHLVVSFDEHFSFRTKGLLS